MKKQQKDMRFEGLTGLRLKVARFIEHKEMQAFIMTLIVINAVTLGLDTIAGLPAGLSQIFGLVDAVVISVFVVELACKLYYRRLSFFKSGWNIFDFLIVVISVMPAMGPFSALRSFRILRVLRLVSFLPQLRFVVNTLLGALPGVAMVSVLLLLVYYVFAILAVNLFGTDFPEYFGSMGGAMFTLFHVMTLEGWTDVARTVMDVYPWAWAFFIPYLMMTTFIFLNMVIGVILNVMYKDSHDAVLESHHDLHREIKALRKDVATLVKAQKTTAAKPAAKKKAVKAKKK